VHISVIYEVVFICMWLRLCACVCWHVRWYVCVCLYSTVAAQRAVLWCVTDRAMCHGAADAVHI